MKKYIHSQTFFYVFQLVECSEDSCMKLIDRCDDYREATRQMQKFSDDKEADFFVIKGKEFAVDRLNIFNEPYFKLCE